jgi:hypothetical protein
MTRAQAWLVVLTCLLLAAWMARRGGSASYEPEGSAAARPAVRPAPDGILEQADRLRAHLASPAPFTPPRRNPFRFAEVPPPAARAGRAAPALSTALVERPDRPDMQLVGIAEDGRASAATRTAIISASTQLFFVKEGERILGRYHVTRIAAETVQLKDPDGSVFTLALR